MPTSLHKIRLISPCYGVFEPLEMQRKIAEYPSSKLLFEFNKDILDQKFAPFSSSPKRRAEELLSSMLDDSVDSIWAIRGGYGAYHLIEYLEKEYKNLSRAKPKTLIGYSDVCTLGLFFIKMLKWPWIHGPVFNNYSQLQEFGDYDFMIDPKEEPKANFTKLNNITVNLSSLEILCANLSILSASLKTQYEPNFKNKFLVVEDLGGNRHQYERAIYQLLHIGALQEIKGLVLGEFQFSDETTSLDDFRSYLAKILEEKDIAVYATNDIGHGTRNFPLLIKG
jgi:muramoyltetrapeptide carboxypeptidase